MGQPKAKKAGSRSKIKKYKRSVWLCNRDKDIDQIQDEISLQQQTGVPVVQRLLTNNDPIQLLEHQQQQQQQQDQNKPAVTNGSTAVQELLPLYDDELPGGGQFYCIETSKHFIDATALANHKKTKFYKRRVKELKEQTHHTHTTADWAAGRTKEILPPVRNNDNNTNNQMNTL